ncbi:MAG: HD domain-containing phosphohydrolase [Chlorobiaceae bacterium]|jgi:HD domain/PAS fold
MQRDELDRTRIELENSLSMYAALYDFAPVGYLTLGRDSKIQQTNLTATKLLGVDRSRLRGMRFKRLVVPEDHQLLDALLETVFTKREPGICEVKLLADAAQPSKLSQTHLSRIVRIDAAISDTDCSCRVILSDITEQKVAEQKINGYVKQLENAMRSTLLADPYTAGHELRVGQISADIAREMGWSEEKCSTLNLSGLVHDIGKMSIPSEILSKPGRLSALMTR